MADSRKRIALKPHMDRIREWVETGKTDDWIADALGTSASSVQSFRSRNDIYRRERGPREPESVFEGVLDHGERDGWGLWLDPSIAEDPIWREHWARVEAVVVKVAEDSIVLEADGGEAGSTDGAADFALSAVARDGAQMRRRPKKGRRASGAASSGSTPRRGTASWYVPRATISSSTIPRCRAILRTSLPTGRSSTRSAATTGARTRAASRT